MQHVSIEITQKCANECIYCSSVSNRECNIQMSTDKIKQIVDGLDRLDTKCISISGGEPFLHPDIVDIVRYIKKKDIEVNIYTSGIVLDNNDNFKALDKDMLIDLKNSKVNKLIFNLQSLDNNTYDEIMGTKNNKDLVLQSIRDSKNLGIFTEIHFVPMKLNYSEIDSIVEFVNKGNADKVSFLGLIPHGRAKENRSRTYLSSEQINTVKHKISQLQGDNVRVGIPLQTTDTDYVCNAGVNKLYIKFDGKVYGCEAFKYINLYDDNGKKIEPDSIYERNIEEIFRKSDYLDAEKKLINKQQNIPNVDEKCPVQKGIRYQGGDNY